MPKKKQSNIKALGDKMEQSHFEAITEINLRELKKQYTLYNKSESKFIFDVAYLHELSNELERREKKKIK